MDDVYGKESWAFDAIFWTKMNKRFFRPVDRKGWYGKGLEERVKLLGEREREGLEQFVEMKLRQIENRRLVGFEPYGIKEVKNRIGKLDL